MINVILTTHNGKVEGFPFKDGAAANAFVNSIRKNARLGYKPFSSVVIKVYDTELRKWNVIKKYNFSEVKNDASTIYEDSKG